MSDKGKPTTPNNTPKPPQNQTRNILPYRPHNQSPKPSNAPKNNPPKK